ncbi:hypothetical protein FISHEDRAFT_70880 [Fistulina hepatica ATCC 64428]|uniref:RRM domain-containing protein n=1 Tax=Fistulina hepatica ATCC 64428 TaxID=1128425 RepID=A0A0D7AI29_9AGAR|nr:hypothetical protein FISHEDRAFT_70880 [Fistulina hepatica ATCC 64428]
MRSRAWGSRFDALATGASSGSLNAGHYYKNGPADGNIKRNGSEKMPHDASVFVGSLPTNIDQSELAHLLSEHLSEHAEVKNVKVVRDAKGGVCAFVQCENATAAANLIRTLHSMVPKPFMGRLLRYEPARAFRTLLISYRVPRQIVPTVGTSTQPEQPQTIELDLPYAMRLWKPHNTKFHQLAYNAEAVDVEHRINTVVQQSHVASPDESAVYLQPVPFDAETIKTLACHFGPLETFEPYSDDAEGARAKAADRDDDVELEELVSTYPAPHDGPRKDGMDPCCFQIKWSHRDDCVSALVTLRRVPHLTVTWAHQPQQGVIDRAPYHHNHQLTTNNTTPYPLHVLQRGQQIPSGTSPGSFHLQNSPGLANISYRESTSDGSEALYGPLPDSDNVSDKLEWSEVDFPPLSDHKPGPKASDMEDIGAKFPLKSREHVLSPLYIAPKTTGNTDLGGYADDERASDVPPTPALGMSPITPKTPGVHFPVTPLTPNLNLNSLNLKDYAGQGDIRGRFEHHKDDHISGLLNRYEHPGDSARTSDRELDPTTLFVGGLEMYGPDSWDEGKIEQVFSCYGGLESVKLVRPANSRAAFAFVKFDNTESPLQAIKEEHNRVYDGRAIRVQLRDCNPPRSPWKQRGRAKPMQHFSALQYCDSTEEPYGQHCAMVHAREESSGFSASADTSVKDSDDTHIVPSTSGEEHLAEDRAADDTEPSFNPDQSADATAARSELGDWFEDVPSPPNFTPPPSSLPAALPTAVPQQPAATPYFMPAGGYFPPPPWMAPYAPHMPYPIPYYGPYPGTVPPHPATPQSFASPIGSDASGPTVSHPAWPGTVGTYGPFMPYPAYFPRPDQVMTSGSGPAGTATTGLSQAPLMPTGFIQNEQGTLIPVYQPEALDQYISTSYNAARPSANTPPQPAWNQFIPGCSFTTPAPGTPHIPTNLPRPLRPTHWTPTQPAAPCFVPSTLPNTHGSGPPAHRYPDGVNNLPPRRHLRKDLNGQRGPHGRGFGHRQNRGGSPETHGNVRGATSLHVGGEWNSWNGSRR